MSREISKEEIENCYGHPLYEACIILGVELKEMKNLLRKHKIKRWPKTRTKNKSTDPFQSFTINKTKEIPKIPDIKYPHAILPQPYKIYQNEDIEMEDKKLATLRFNKTKEIQIFEENKLKERQVDQEKDKTRKVMGISNICN